MNINIYNYEEFFVLYWDNELSAEQKKKVESFVEEKKELLEEFRLFGETRFTPDQNTLFKEKDLLLINENSGINFSNYIDILLSYIDGELTDDLENDVEKFIARHPAVQKELSILQKTKLQAEPEIVFPDKTTLYRKTEKPGVIYLSWMKVTVAAALILIAGFVTIRVINSNTRGEMNELVLTESSVNKKKPVVPDNRQIPVETPQTEPPVAVTPVKKEKQKIPSENLLVKNKVIADPENKNDLPKVKFTEDPSLIAQQINPEQPAKTAFPQNNTMDNIAVATTNQKDNNRLFEDATVTERPAPSYAIYDASDEPGEYVDHGGLKGLLRKATRVFERRTKMQTTTDDNKLLVGVFAVSLK